MKDVIEPFWRDWPHANIHAAISPDVLHQIVQGVGKHLVEWLLELAPKAELDARMQRLPLSHGLRHFKHGISDLSNISGPEHRAIYAQVLGCVHGLVPDDAVQAANALMDFLYIAQYECHSDTTLASLQQALTEFHELKNVFKAHGVWKGVWRRVAHVYAHSAQTLIYRSCTRFSTTSRQSRCSVQLTITTPRRQSAST